MNALSPVRGWRSLAVMVVTLSLAALACGAPTVEPTATPLPRPTQRPAATNTSAAPAPTARPTAKATTASNEFDLVPYDHPSGAFSVGLPDGWEQEESDSRVLVTSPDAVVAIDITFYNAGKPLDKEALTNFINSVEANWFGSFPNYVAGDLVDQSDGSIGVLKTMELNSGTPQTVLSYYWQDGDVIYETDFWIDTVAYDEYVDQMVAVANSVTTDADAGAEQDVYAIIYTFTDVQRHFEFSVPFGWTFATDDPKNMTVDTFTGPDGDTFIENITYNDGQTVDDLTDFAEQVLTDYYGIDDLEVTKVDGPTDGVTYLDWNSPSRGLVGVSRLSRLEASPQVYILTWVAATDEQNIYQPVWDYLLSTYAIPTPE